MRLAILKDGTIPVAVAQIVAYDRGADLHKFAEELAASDGHEHVELFEVPDHTPYVYVSWDEFMGFQVRGADAKEDALDMLYDGATPDAIVRSYLAPDHWAVTYGEGDDETYGHVFQIGYAQDSIARKGR